MGDKSLNDTASAVMAELREGRTSVLFDAVGSPHYVKPPAVTGAYWFVSPYLWLGSLFTSIFYTYDPGMYDFNGGFCHSTNFQLHGIAIAGFVFAVVGRSLPPLVDT